FSTLRDHSLVVLGVFATLFGGKWLAANAAARLFGYARPECDLMFALTIPQGAATLAVALVAYSSKNAAGDRLSRARMLNATVVLVIVSSLVGLLLTQRAVAEFQASGGKHSSEGSGRSLSS